MNVKASGSQPCLIYILTGGVNNCRFQSSSHSSDPLEVAHQCQEYTEHKFFFKKSNKSLFFSTEIYTVKIIK